MPVEHRVTMHRPTAVGLVERCRSADGELGVSRHKLTVGDAVLTKPLREARVQLVHGVVALKEEELVAGQLAPHLHQAQAALAAELLQVCEGGGLKRGGEQGHEPL